MKKNFKFILFDLDDTLIDNRKNISFAFSKVLDARNQPYNESIFSEWFQFDENFWQDFVDKKIEVPAEYMQPNERFIDYVRGLRFVKFFNDIDIEQGISYNKIYIENLGQVVEEIEGAKKVLSTLCKKYTLVVATNGPSEAVNVKLEKIGCQDYISYIFAADKTKKVVVKPYREYFEELKEYLGEQDNDVFLYVGDSLNKDIKGANNIGFDCVWLNKNGKNCPEKYQPTYEIKKLVELLDLI